ncbi:hypothetical protein [Lichenibacterium ramalinae]|uniref:hypothetical protein n=1 Tax=Lichenibacterium ramalinae TaxID=2316527 RepID=UPI00100E86A9|nr:hypothetical protein [Lichenibacterium ramalinae]
MRSEASVVNRTFHDVRGTAATLFAMAGTGVFEIAAMAGHSVGDLQGILDKTFLHRDEHLWEAGVDRIAHMLEVVAAATMDIVVGEIRPARRPNGSVGLGRDGRNPCGEAA